VGEFEVDADLVRGVLRIPVGANFIAAQAPSPALLVLEKSDSTLAIVDPASLQVVARVPAGPDPHEIVASRTASWPTSRTMAVTTAL